MDAIETKHFDHGVTLEIHHYPDAEQPYECDEGVRIVILHRRYDDPAQGECGTDPDEVAAWVKANSREWFVSNLFMYEHSGVALRAGESNPFGCPWDSGQVGIVALKKDEWGRGKGERNAKRMEYAKNVAEHYGQWMNGETYGYVVNDEDGEQLDSCCGFVGWDDVWSEGTASAKGFVESEAERQAQVADAEAQRMADCLMAQRPDMYGAATA